MDIITPKQIAPTTATPPAGDTDNFSELEVMGMVVKYSEIRNAIPNAIKSRYGSKVAETIVPKQISDLKQRLIHVGQKADGILNDFLQVALRHRGIHPDSDLGAAVALAMRSELLAPSEAVSELSAEFLQITWKNATAEDIAKLKKQFINLAKNKAEEVLKTKNEDIKNLRGKLASHDQGALPDSLDHKAWENISKRRTEELQDEISQKLTEDELKNSKLDFAKVAEKSRIEKANQSVVVVNSRKGWGLSKPGILQSTPSQDDNKVTNAKFQQYILKHFGSVATDLLWNSESELQMLYEKGYPLTKKDIRDTIDQANRIAANTDLHVRPWANGHPPSNELTKDQKSDIIERYEKRCDRVSEKNRDIAATHRGVGYAPLNEDLFIPLKGLPKKDLVGEPGRAYKNKQTILAFMDYLEAKGIGVKTRTYVWKHHFEADFTLGKKPLTLSKAEAIFAEADQINRAEKKFLSGQPLESDRQYLDAESLKGTILGDYENAEELAEVLNQHVEKFGWTQAPARWKELNGSLKEVEISLSSELTQQQARQLFVVLSRKHAGWMADVKHPVSQWGWFKGLDPSVNWERFKSWVASLGYTPVPKTPEQAKANRRKLQQLVELIARRYGTVQAEKVWKKELGLRAELGLGLSRAEALGLLREAALQSEKSEKDLGLNFQDLLRNSCANRRAYGLTKLQFERLRQMVWAKAHAEFAARGNPITSEKLESFINEAYQFICEDLGKTPESGRDSFPKISDKQIASYWNNWGLKDDDVTRKKFIQLWKAGIIGLETGVEIDRRRNNSESLKDFFGEKLNELKALATSESEDLPSETSNRNGDGTSENLLEPSESNGLLIEEISLEETQPERVTQSRSDAPPPISVPLGLPSSDVKKLRGQYASAKIPPKFISSLSANEIKDLFKVIKKTADLTKDTLPAMEGLFAPDNPALQMAGKALGYSGYLGAGEYLFGIYSEHQRARKEMDKLEGYQKDLGIASLDCALGMQETLFWREVEKEPGLLARAGGASIPEGKTPWEMLADRWEVSEEEAKQIVEKNSKSAQDRLSGAQSRLKRLIENPADPGKVTQHQLQEARYLISLSGVVIKGVQQINDTNLLPLVLNATALKATGLILGVGANSLAAGISAYRTYKDGKTFLKAQAKRQSAEKAMQQNYRSFIKERQTLAEKVSGGVSKSTQDWQKYQRGDVLFQAHLKYRQAKQQKKIFGDKTIKVSAKKLISHNVSADIARGIARAQPVGSKFMGTGRNAVNTVAYTASAAIGLIGLGVMVGGSLGTIAIPIPGIGTLTGATIGFALGLVAAGTGLAAGLGTFLIHYAFKVHWARKLANRIQQWQDAAFNQEGEKWRLMEAAGIPPHECCLLAMRKLIRRDPNVAIKQLAYELKREVQSNPDKRPITTMLQENFGPSHSGQSTPEADRWKGHIDRLAKLPLSDLEKELKALLIVS